jgi:hypothetical protein
MLAGLFWDSGVTSLVLFSFVWYLDCGGFLVDDVMDWSDLATRYCLASTDYLDQRTLWTQEFLITVLCNLLNHTRKAIPFEIGDNQFVKLSSSDRISLCIRITAPQYFPNPERFKTWPTLITVYGLAIPVLPNGPSPFLLTDHFQCVESLA